MTLHAMEWLQLTLFVIASAKFTSATGECVCGIIVALPYLHGNGSQPAPIASWERGVEILQGAQIAKERINNISKCQLELTEVNTGQCGIADNFSLIEQLLTIVRSQKNFHLNHQCLEVPVIGLSCNNIVFMDIILSLNAEELIKDSIKVEVKAFVPKSVRSNTAAPLIGALFKFMQSQSWQKLGIITETDSTYFSHMAEEIYIKAKNDSKVNVDVIAYRQLQANEKISPIKVASKITLLSTGFRSTVDILCSAYDENTVWPEYVWILHSYLLEDIKGIHTTCSISKALENVSNIYTTTNTR